ncbi:FecCD family ABC transporter permease [Brevibacterium casei]|uniref:FecCD family ABC transporter permease n=2 Tax=Brevibacterium casei TaxID=33889 RepID=UPI000E6565AB|nr:iron ABC transporter permease [Brevibacterium casei]MCT1551179.1 iron ABC transporter permease [Brevibacterium casei]MCT1560258.1 iron ABC transporter permease [Brevibacterium casei]MCT2207513.1 iron ABC transporter permease [Brevibacterium casei]MDH5147447.1 iron ABC transporter permease [Brevibacterium casei]
MTATALAPAPASRRHRRGGGPLGLAVLGVVVIVGLSVLVGSRSLDVAAVASALFGQGTAEATAIVWEQRVPRTLFGLFGGAALAAAGVVIQGHTRNPLADPGLLGVTAGASLAVVLSIAVLGLATPAEYLWSAYLGAGLGAAVVLVIGVVANRRRDASPASLVLAGAAVSALLGAISGVVLLLDQAALDVYRFWTVGSLAGSRGLDSLSLVAPLMIAGAILAAAQSRSLDALALGSDMARSLGRRLLPVQIAGPLSVTLLVGGATALVGSLGFVGLVAPHIARGIVGPAHGRLLPLSAVLGAALVLAADVLGRLLVAPAELPVGIVLGIIGGPVFLILVIRLYRRRP